MNRMPAEVKLVALLPATDRGKMNAVSTLPPCVTPPTAVRLFARSAARPAGAATSIIAGNVVDPVAKARSDAAPAAIVFFNVAATSETDTGYRVGSVDVPP